MIGLGVRAANGPLEILDLPEPRQPETGELILDVVAAGIGPWDTLLHSGAVLIAATGTAEDAMGLLVDGGRLVAITLDSPAPVRGITTTDLYVQPDGVVLGELAALVAAGELSIDVQTTPIRDGIAVADQVAAGRSGGVKHVLEV